MRITVVYNPVAGAGNAAAVAREMIGVLESSGHATTLVQSQAARPKEWLDAALADTDVMVVAGGDGAMRLAAPSAIRTRTAIYHLPLGTENLFAREFGMDRSSQRLLGALDRGEVRPVDVADADGETSLLMVSLGYDAEVVHDLAQRRGASISRLSYAMPIARQFRRWRPPRLTVTTDGRRIVGDEPGFVVIANSRQYARHLDPALDASMTDGLLDVVFFPTPSRAALVKWAIGCIRGRHVRDARLVYERGRDIRISCEPPCRFQIDGDPPAGRGAEVVQDLHVVLQPRQLDVLIP